MDFHAIVGTPKSLAVQNRWQSGGHNFVSSALNPILIFVEEINGEEHGIQQTQAKRFVGHLSPLNDTESIAGMSGGPILGFKKTDDGQLKYYPVAIQSRWLERRKIIIGTPLIVVGQVIEKLFRQLEAEGAEEVQS
jgi:hypothetical protein